MNEIAGISTKHTMHHVHIYSVLRKIVANGISLPKSSALT